MRFSRRGDKKRVLWLTRFYEAWCDKEELDRRTKRFMEQLKNSQGTLSAEYIFWKTEALAGVKQLDIEMQHELLQHSRQFLEKSDKEFVKYLSVSDKELFEKAKKLKKEKKYEEAIDLLFKMNNKNYNRIAIYYENIENYKEAETYYLKAIYANEEKAFYDLADFYKESLKDYEQAKEWYLKGIEYEYKEENKHRKYWCLNDLAFLYKTIFKDYEKAEEYYLQAIELGNEHAIRNLATLYHYSLKDYEQAKEWYLKGIKYEYKEGNKYIKHWCLNDLAVLYKNQFQDYEKAEEYYWLME